MSAPSSSPLAADAARVARGSQPAPFEHTASHPVHGDLTFRCERMPTVMQLADHAVAMDNLLADLVGEARVTTMVTTAAIAGLAQLPDQPGRSVFMALPVVREDRVDDDTSGSVKIERVFYDVVDETDLTFLVDVWTAFSAWRSRLLSPEGVDAVKGSSGETSSPA